MWTGCRWILGEMEERCRVGIMGLRLSREFVRYLCRDTVSVAQTVNLRAFVVTIRNREIEEVDGKHLIRVDRERERNKKKTGQWDLEWQRIKNQTGF